MLHPSGSPITLDRRSFLRFSALGIGVLTLSGSSFALTGCAPGDDSSGGGTLTPFSTKLGWIPDVAYAGLFIASAEGLFTKAGLDVTIQPGGPNSPVAPLVTTGRLDVGIESIPENVAAAVNDGRLV